MADLDSENPKAQAKKADAVAKQATDAPSDNRGFRETQTCHEALEVADEEEEEEVKEEADVEAAKSGIRFTRWWARASRI